MKTYQEIVEILALQTAASITGGGTGYIEGIRTYAQIYDVSPQKLEHDIASKYEWAYQIAMHGRK